MDPLVLKNVVYHFQDLVSQKKVKTFTKFLAGIKTYYELPCMSHISRKFIYNRLKSMHAFLKEIQSHPNSHLLSHALKPLFEYLLHGIVVPRVVYVLDKKYEGHPNSIFFMKYSDLIIAAQGRRLIQTDNNVFVIPFKGYDRFAHPFYQSIAQSGIRNGWAMRFLSEMLTVKIFFSLVGYWRMPILYHNIMNGDKNYYDELLDRAGWDYLTSDSEYFPLEMFDLETPPIFQEGSEIKNKYDSWMRLLDRLCFQI